MRPSPFAGKFKRKEIKIQKVGDKNEQTYQQDNQRYPQQTNLKIPITTQILKKSKQKEEKDKYRINENAKQDNQQQKQQKITLSSYRPNLKVKSGTFGKKLKIFNNQAKKDQDAQNSQQQYRSIKTTGNKKNQQRKDGMKEDVIIGEQQKIQSRQEESVDESNNYSHSMNLIPKFQIKSKHKSEFPIIEEEQREESVPVLNNETEIKIQNREINLTNTNQNISAQKLEKQQVRVKQLKNLLNLQIDLFEQTLNMSSITSYEVYINKIKNGILKNSNDQTFDQTLNEGCQTSTLQYQNFINQCPQDYYNDINYIIQKDDNEILQNFVQQIAPIFQQLIKPSNQVVMPPIFLLAMKPQLKKMLACPFPLFVYYSSMLELGIIVIGQKLYITDCQIQTVLSLNNYLVAGSKDGTIYLWSGKNDSRSRLYRKVFQHIQSTNFELPSCSTEDLDRYSIYRSNDKIVSLLNELTNYQFSSLDYGCKLIKWKIQRTNNNMVSIKPFNSYQFINIIQRPNLIGYDLKKRNQNYFICSSAGILVWNGEQLIQRLDTEGFKINCITLPHRSHLIYTVCQDKSIRIYEEHYSTELYKLYLPDSAQLVDVIVPETEYDNKKLSLTSNVFISTSNGCIYSINLLSNGSEAKPIINWGDRNFRDIIFKGVNKLPRGFELVSVYRDLKCTTEQKKMNINLDSTVENIKNILQENRKVYNWLESLNSLIIVQ